jgi:hypothetical protein
MEMKPLSKVCPDPQKLLSHTPESLGKHVLCCLSDTNEPNIERAIIARTLASGYHQSLQQEIGQSVEAALEWLLRQCLLGEKPYSHDLIYLTRRGKEAAAEYDSACAEGEC